MPLNPAAATYVQPAGRPAHCQKQGLKSRAPESVRAGGGHTYALAHMARTTPPPETEEHLLGNHNQAHLGNHCLNNRSIRTEKEMNLHLRRTLLQILPCNPEFLGGQSSLDHPPRLRRCRCSAGPTAQKATWPCPPTSVGSTSSPMCSPRTNWSTWTSARSSCLAPPPFLVRVAYCVSSIFLLSHVERAQRDREALHNRTKPPLGK